MRTDAGGGGSVFTPPPGQPGAVRSAAHRLAGQSGELAALSRAGSGARGSLAGEAWSGPASEAFGRFAAGTERLAGASEPPLGDLVRAATTYADALDTAQRRIHDAAQRHAAAVASADRIAGEVNSDPNRTPAQVHAAQLEVDRCNRDAQAAEDDARAAWAAYEHECERAAAIATRAAGEMRRATASSPVLAVLQKAGGRAGGPAGEHESEGMEVFHALKLTLFDIRDLQATGFGAIGLLRAYERGAGSFLEQARAWSESGDGYRGLQQMFEGEGLDALVRGGLSAEEMSPAVSGLADVVGAVGKTLGPLGVATSTFETVHDFTSGHYGRGAYDAVETAFAAGVVLPVPGVDLACGAGALAMEGGKQLYDHVAAVREFVNHPVDETEHALA
ncbi:MAG: hypothetical protein ACRDPH_07285, partial [Marmoricola sp.]